MMNGEKMVRKLRNKNNKILPIYMNKEVDFSIAVDKVAERRFKDYIAGIKKIRKANTTAQKS